MEHPARDSLCRPRPVATLASTAALFALGFALSAHPQQASAGGLPLPTVTLPGVTTVTLPTVTTPTVVTTTTAAVTATAVGAPAPATPKPEPATAAAARSTAQVTGAKRLRSGAVSIPVSSVRAPARLRLVVKFVRSARAGSIRAQVIDTRGYLVRGARVSMLSAPVRALASAKSKLSTADGTAVFRVRPRKTTQLRTVVALTVRAVDPAAPALANTASRLRLTIRAGS
jgi:hypothetical protein